VQALRLRRKLLTVQLISLASGFSARTISSAIFGLNTPVIEETTAAKKGCFRAGRAAPASGATSRDQPLAVVALKTAGQGQQNAQQVDQHVAMPAAIQQATCQVLNLVLRPLHSNLLGLEVDLNQVVLNITANPQGGLLGSVLCSLAGQGGAVATLNTVIGLLGQILGALGGL
jgi:hypothetical protein